MRRLLIVAFFAGVVATEWFGAGPRAWAQQALPTQPPEGAVWYNEQSAEGRLGTDNDDLRWRRQNASAFRTALQALKPNDAQRRELQIAAEHYAKRMTNPKERADLPSLTTEVLNRLNSFAKGEAKQVFLNALTQQLSRLFRQRDLVVRVNAANFLSRLDAQAAGFGADQPAKPYWPAYRPLIGAVEDPNQEVAVKLRAVNGLGRILRASDIPRKERDDVLIRLAAVLDFASDPINWPKEARRGDYWTFILALVDAIRDAGIAKTLSVQPVPVEKLVKIALDPRQHWVVRSTSIRHLSELPLEDDTAIDVGLLAKIAVSLLDEAITEYDGDRKAWYWRQVFLNLYFAFKPLKAEQASRLKYGFLAKLDEVSFRKHSNTINAAYQAVLGVAKVMSPAPQGKGPVLPNNVVDSVKDFVEQNPPAGRVHPRIADVKSMRPVARQAEAGGEAEN